MLVHLGQNFLRWPDQRQVKGAVANEAAGRLVYLLQRSSGDGVPVRLQILDVQTGQKAIRNYVQDSVRTGEMER